MKVSRISFFLFLCVSFFLQNGLKSAQEDLKEGFFVYRNTAASSWSVGDSYSTLALSGDSRLVVLESLNMGIGRLQISKQASTSVASGKQLTATIFMVE